MNKIGVGDPSLFTIPLIFMKFWISINDATSMLPFRFFYDLCLIANAELNAGLFLEGDYVMNVDCSDLADA